MIHFLTGRLAEKHPTRAVLDVNGVGYLVNIPTSTYENLSELGSTVHLHTMLHVRDDAMQLFGFGSMAEREVFETMLSVSGIGPKLALAALSAMKPSDIRDSVVAGDTVMLTRIPGVGRKTAERMIVELRDRMAALGASERRQTPPGLRVTNKAFGMGRRLPIVMRWNRDAVHDIISERS